MQAYHIIVKPEIKGISKIIYIIQDNGPSAFDRGKELCEKLNTKIVSGPHKGE